MARLLVCDIKIQILIPARVKRAVGIEPDISYSSPSALIHVSLASTDQDFTR